MGRVLKRVEGRGFEIVDWCREEGGRGEGRLCEVGGSFALGCAGAGVSGLWRVAGMFVE